MRRLERGEAPACLGDYAPRRHQWEDLLASTCITGIREHLHEMQGGSCVYCECHLSVGNQHVEHFWARSRYPEQTFSWENLFLSCEYGQHCGRYKGGRDASGLIKPDEEDPEHFLQFWENGEATARQGLDERDRERAERTIEMLNLNAPQLRSKRYRFIRIYRDRLDSAIAEIQGYLEGEQVASGDVETAKALLEEEVQRILDDIDIDDPPYESAIRQVIRRNRYVGVG